MDDRGVLTVSELNGAIRRLLEGRFPFVSVAGEISNLARPASGHLYFTLKDQGAQLKAVLFKLQRRYLAETPRDGAQVVCRGRISVYEPRGDYQLIVDTIDFRGAGALQQAFEALKRRLAAEGLFDEHLKRRPPPFPEHITLVTSPRGAAVHDFLKIAGRRCPQVRISVYPVAVQGAQAAAEMIQALADINRRVTTDVIVLCRGGGSIEDLQAFNDEGLARAIRASSLPVVSGVGHEIDFTIADFAADLRAPTPSGAAELLTPDREGLRTAVTNCRLRLRRVLAARIDREHQRLALARQRLHTMTHPLDKLLLRLDHLALGLEVALKRRLMAQHQRLDALVCRLAQRQPAHRLALQAQRVQELHYRLVQATQEGLREQARRFSRATGVLQAVSPLATLARGYSVVRRVGPDRAVVIDQAQVQAGERVEVLLHRGELFCRIEGKKQAEDGGAATPDQSRTASTS